MKPFVADNPTRIAVDGAWKNAQAAYKAMTTRASSMANILAIRTKGFRSNELADPVVKAEIAKAQARVKSAQAEVKKYDKDYDKAKKLAADLTEKLKKAKK